MAENTFWIDGEPTPGKFEMHYISPDIWSLLISKPQGAKLIEVMVNNYDFKALGFLVTPIDAAAPERSQVLSYDCRTTDQRLAALEERIDHLAIPGLRAQVNAIDDRVKALDAAAAPAVAMREIEKRIDALVAEAAQKFSQAERRLAVIEGNISDLMRQSAGVTSVQKGFARIDQRLDQRVKQIDEQALVLVDHDQRLETVEGRIKSAITVMVCQELEKLRGHDARG